MQNEYLNGERTSTPEIGDRVEFYSDGDLCIGVITSEITYGIEYCVDEDGGKNGQYIHWNGQDEQFNKIFN